MGNDVDCGGRPFVPLPDERSIRRKLLEVGYSYAHSVPLQTFERFANLVSQCSGLQVSGNLLTIILSQAIVFAVINDCCLRKAKITDMQKAVIDGMLECGPQFIEVLVGNNLVSSEAKQLWANGRANEITYGYVDCSALTAR